MGSKIRHRLPTKEGSREHSKKETSILGSSIPDLGVKLKLG